MDNTTAVLQDTKVAILASVSLSDFVNSIMDSGFMEYEWWKDITFHNDAHRLIDASFTVKHWTHLEIKSEGDEPETVSTRLTYRDLVNSWDETLRRNVRSITLNPDDIDIDADLADIVLQRAVYGTVVFA